MTKELKQKAEEWRKNYTPMGITCIERDGVVIETQSKATRCIENPNPFRIKDGWCELYFRDLDNAYIAGATETIKELQAQVEQLTKAKKIIRKLITLVDFLNEENVKEPLVADAEAFLKE